MYNNTYNTCYLQCKFKKLLVLEHECMGPPMHFFL